MLVLVVSEPYRVKRLTAYTDPWADPYDTGFQLTQSLIAFGRGEWFGVGLGNSVQKLFYLPEAHTDFVFSIWAEETGFVGALAVIGLYAALIGRIFWVGAGDSGEKSLWRLCLLWRGPGVFRAGLCQYGGELRPVADQGTDPAFCQLWRHQPDCVLCHAGPGAAHRPRYTRGAEAQLMAAQQPLVLMMAGGTGGHVYPALAVATELLDRGYRVEWVGTARGLEHRVVPAAGITLHCLSVRGVRGKSMLHKLLGVLLLALASLQALWLVFRRHPAVWWVWVAMSPARPAWPPGCCASPC